MTESPESRGAPDTEGGEVFPPTADGVLTWVSTTQPPPARDAVVEYVRWVVAKGYLGSEDLEKLIQAGYHELAE